MISNMIPSHHQQALTNKFAYTEGVPWVGYKSGPGIKTMTRGRGNSKMTKS